MNSRRGGSWLDVFLPVSVVIISLFEFKGLIWSPSFGPEFSIFFPNIHNHTFFWMLHGYLDIKGNWYRPTQFYPPFWIGDHTLDWHNLAGWRAYELATVLAVCLLLYVLVLQLLPGHRGAAFFAALYFTWVPTINVPLHDLFGFDFLHIVFTLTCVIAFIAGYRATGAKRWGLTAASWIAFLIALTCKEPTVVVPAFLAFASIILLRYEAPPRVPSHALRHEAIRLAPFWGLLPLYWLVHLRWAISQFGASGTYRLGANWPVILENLAKYPLWFSRMYGFTADRANQAVGYINPRNGFIGVALLVFVIVAWIRLSRKDRQHREAGLLACAWIGVFLSVPVYSGGLFWHGNLALCGYCILFGVAAEWALRMLQSRGVRLAGAAVFVLGATALTRADASQGLVAGFFANAYRINGTVFADPPLPPDRVGGKALVYVEDWQNLDKWYFGGGTLFKLVYLNTELEQVLVPTMESIEPAALSRWLKDPNAFYFRYDNQYRWQDATEEFRRFAAENANKIPRPPVITDFNPKATQAGVPINVQPDGTAAIGFAGRDFRRGAELLINGVSTPVIFGGPGFITVALAPEGYAHPGNVRIQVRDPDGQVSNVVTFRVWK